MKFVPAGNLDSMEQAEAIDQDTSSPSRRGPRSDGGAGRERILAAATAQFGERGYQATTIRKIAEAAGVDPKLVYYYYGTKEKLLSTVIGETFRSRGLPDLLLKVSTTGDTSPGTQYLLAVLAVLEDPTAGPAFIGLVRGLGTHKESREIFFRFVSEEILGQLSHQIGSDHPDVRMALAGSQMLGLITARYVLKVPLITELSREQIANNVGPTIDRYLFGKLDWEV